LAAGGAAKTATVGATAAASGASLGHAGSR
jgi:hypothetical protein